MTLDNLRQKREAIFELARRYGAYNVRVFGSVVRGEADEKSDVDFLVDFEPGRSLLDHGGLWYDLEQFLNCKIDIATVHLLKERIRERAMREAIPL